MRRRRWHWILPILLLVLGSVASGAGAQPDCADGAGLAPGYWTGEFEVSWTLAWTADLPNRPRSEELASARWERTETVRGTLHLRAEAGKAAGDSAVAGVASARWQTTTRARREDGAQATGGTVHGNLTGGAVAAEADGPVAVGTALAWGGVWLVSEAVAEHCGSARYQAADGTNSPIGDFGCGVFGAPSEPVRFAVETLACGAVTGQVHSAAFDRVRAAPAGAFGLPPPGPAAGVELLQERSSFRLAHRPRPH